MASSNGSRSRGGLRYVRWGAWALVAAAALGWAWHAAGGLDLFKRSDGSLIGSVRIGGPFRLVSHLGEPFDSARLKGAPYALFFGFTHCPDVCPTTLLEMTHHLAALGPAAAKLQVVFVTVDPERDTATLLKDYLSAFDARIVGLTGSPADIAAVARGYRAFYEKVPGKDGAYSMNHAASVYLFDAAGGFAGTLNYQEPQDIQRAKLRRLVQ